MESARGDTGEGYVCDVFNGFQEVMRLRGACRKGTGAARRSGAEARIEGGAARGRSVRSRRRLWKDVVPADLTSRNVKRNCRATAGIKAMTAALSGRRYHHFIIEGIVYDFYSDGERFLLRETLLDILPPE